MNCMSEKKTLEWDFRPLFFAIFSVSTKDIRDIAQGLACRIYEGVLNGMRISLSAPYSDMHSILSHAIWLHCHRTETHS